MQLQHIRFIRNRTVIQKFSYHTHTDFSDGRNSAEEMILKAKEIGWQEIGISDHLTIHKNIKTLPDYSFTAYKRGAVDGLFMYSSFAEIKESALRHFEHLEALGKKHNIKVLKGFEVDYFTYSGWEEELKEFIKELQPDYLLSGNHFVFDEECEKILDIYYIKHKKPLNDSELQDYLTRHYKTIEKAIRSGLFDFIAHLDYSRAANNSIDVFKAEKISVVKALSECNVATELSTKGTRKHGEPYPAYWLLDELIKNEVSIVISDDAHRVNELGVYFDKAEEMLEKANHKKRFKL